jgi:hypothetical protein
VFRRPFWKLNGEKEVESFTGWDELDTRNYYSQAKHLHLKIVLYVCDRFVLINRYMYMLTRFFIDVKIAVLQRACMHLNYIKYYKDTCGYR